MLFSVVSLSSMGFSTGNMVLFEFLEVLSAYTPHRWLRFYSSKFLSDSFVVETVTRYI